MKFHVGTNYVKQHLNADKTVFSQRLSYTKEEAEYFSFFKKDMRQGNTTETVDVESSWCIKGFASILKVRTKLLE
jgi:hypothetical protein